jgi:hypothetical protein
VAIEELWDAENNEDGELFCLRLIHDHGQQRRKQRGEGELGWGIEGEPGEEK